jgi:signal transduction histidine kinase
MKRSSYLIVSYILVFSLLGIGILQYVFIENQKELLEKQMVYSIKNVLNEVQSQIKYNEIKKIAPHILNYSDSQAGILDQIIKSKKNKDTIPVNEGHALEFDNTLDPDGEILNEQNSSNKPDVQKIELAYQYIKDYIPSKPISQRVDKKEVDSLIKRQLQKIDLNIPYEYAILDDGVPTLIQSEHFSLDRRNHLLIRYPLFDNENKNNGFYELAVSVKKSDIHRKDLLVFQILSYLFTAFLMLSFIITTYNMMRQRHLSELKNDFINNITHEFKTPIATIGLVIDSIKSPNIISDPEKIKHYLRILKEENQRMLSQVEKILFLSKLEQGKIIFDKQPVDMHEIIGEAINHMDLIFKSKNARVNLMLEAKHPYISGDSVFLFDMLINLLDNAVKYSKDFVDITIKTRNENGNLVIEISDKGVGMGKDVLDRVFEKFFRKPTGSIHNVKGHGIGLTFVKQVVDKHMGKISVKSVENQGTTFTIRFPVIWEVPATKREEKN